MCHFPQVYNPSFINRETGASEKYVQPSGKKNKEAMRRNTY